MFGVAGTARRKCIALSAVLASLWRSSISILVLLLAACTPPEPQHDFSGEEAFQTTDPSRLFFLNVRASSYYQEAVKGQHMDLYRNRKFSQTATRPLLIPIIINAWVKHEAYLFVRPNKFPSLAPTLRVRYTGDSTSGIYSLNTATRPEQYAFATQLYSSIVEGHELEVMLADSSFAPIFQDRGERAAYLATVQDYYRLTERI